MPDKLRVSYGTAIELGLIKARHDVAPTTAYLLFDNGCKGQCSFCSRANGNAKSKKLSRIVWPEFDLPTILEKLCSEQSKFERICLQTGFNSSFDETIKKIAAQLQKTNKRISVSLSPSSVELATSLLNAGVDHLGIGLDAATEATYRCSKKRNWAKDWSNLEGLMRDFPEKIEVHLIFGLGDTEEEFLSCVQKIYDAGGRVSLFAFTPVNGGTPPLLSAYRRVQCGRFLIESGQKRFEDYVFRDGLLRCLGLEKSELIKALKGGEAFRTSGCGDCNRPYYNERPGKPFFNFPRPLFKPEFLQAVEQTEIFLQSAEGA